MESRPPIPPTDLPSIPHPSVRDLLLQHGLIPPPLTTTEPSPVTPTSPLPGPSINPPYTQQQHLTNFHQLQQILENGKVLLAIQKAMDDKKFVGIFSGQPTTSSAPTQFSFPVQQSSTPNFPTVPILPPPLNLPTHNLEILKQIHGLSALTLDRMLDQTNSTFSAPNNNFLKTLLEAELDRKLKAMSPVERQAFNIAKACFRNQHNGAQLPSISSISPFSGQSHVTSFVSPFTDPIDNSRLTTKHPTNKGRAVRFQPYASKKSEKGGTRKHQSKAGSFSTIYSKCAWFLQPEPSSLPDIAPSIPSASITVAEYFKSLKKPTPQWPDHSLLTPSKMNFVSSDHSVLDSSRELTENPSIPDTVSQTAFVHTVPPPFTDPAVVLGFTASLTEQQQQQTRYARQAYINDFLSKVNKKRNMGKTFKST